MKIWKVILVTLVIFGTGAVTGGLLVNRVCTRPTGVVRQTEHNHSGQRFRADRALRMGFITRIKDELQLSPEQLAKIEAIVQESQKRTRAIWEQCAPEMRAEFKATKEKIDAVLTEEQRQKFKELMKQHRLPHREDGNQDETATPPLSE